MGFLSKRKALSSLLIIIIVSSIVVVAIGAVAVYFWFWPGNLKMDEGEFSNFTSVEVGWAFEVEIVQSSSYRVIITADERIFDDIEVTQTDNTLQIGFKLGSYPGGLFRKAEITMPELDKLVLSGASNGAVEGFSSPNTFLLSLSGASRLEMTNMNVGDVEIEVSGASNLNAEGSANNLFSLVSGASNLGLSDFPVDDADVDISGASQATIKLEGTLDAQVSGASTLQYIGDPTMGNVSTSGGSTIKKK